MGVFKAAENSGHMIQPLVFCYDNPQVDWGSTGAEKDLFKSILDFYKNKISGVPALGPPIGMISPLFTLKIKDFCSGKVRPSGDTI